MKQPSYDSKLDELEQLRLEREAKTAPAKLAPPSPPPTVVIKLEYVSPDGSEYTADLTVRILTQDEILRANQLASLFAGSDFFDYLPEFARRLCLARAHINVMWGKQVPEWLKTALEADETISLQIYDAITSHRAAWFRGDYRQSGSSEKASGLALTTISPSGTKKQ